MNQSSLLSDPTTDIIKHQAGQVHERAAVYGASALSDRELISIYIGADAADALLFAAGSLSNLAKWTTDEIRQIKGIGQRGANAICAAFQMSSRMIAAESHGAIYDSPEMVFRLMTPETTILEVEKVWTLCLDRKNRLIKKVEVTKGTANASLVHPREVFREAIKIGSSAIIAVHNHPSGDPAPSRADIQVTRQLREAAKVIGIDLLDHIVIGNRSRDPQGLGFYSFNDSGLI